MGGVRWQGVRGQRDVHRNVARTSTSASTRRGAPEPARARTRTGPFPRDRLEIRLLLFVLRGQVDISHGRRGHADEPDEEQAHPENTEPLLALTAVHAVELQRRLACGVLAGNQAVRVAVVH